MRQRPLVSIAWCSCVLTVLAGAPRTAAAAAVAISPDEALMTALGLRSGYNSAARPPPDNGTANVVNVFVYLSSLVEVDSTAQEIVLQLWLDLLWCDSRLVWLGRFNSSHDAVPLIMAPSSLVWQPDVAFYDMYDYAIGNHTLIALQRCMLPHSHCIPSRLKVKHVSSDNVIVGINSTGFVHLTYQVVIKSKCKMQLLAFPFDTQTCNTNVASMLQGPDTVRLRIQTFPTSKDSVISFLSKSGEFCINSAKILLRSTIGFEHAVFTVVFTRMSAFYVVNLILPSILLLATSTLSFCLPPECDERVAFSITIVLSMCVFLQLTGNYTPTQSETVPLLTCYYSVAVVMTMANVLGNVFVLKFFYNHLTETRVNNRIIRAVFLNRFATGRWRVRASDQRAQTREGNGANVRHDTDNGTEQTLGSDATDPRPDTVTKDSADVNEWKLAAAAADNVFFAIFFIITVAILLALVIIEAKNSHIDCVRGTAEED